MCEFVSLIVFGPRLTNLYGEIVSCTRHGNSHSRTEDALGLNVKNDFAWAKVEVVPSKELLDFDSYTFRLDEDRTPDWWTDGHQTRSTAAGITEARDTVKVDERGRVTHWPGTIDRQTCAGDLNTLTAVGGALDCSDYAGDLSALTTVGGILYCSGYAGDMSALTTVGGNPYKHKAVKK